MEIKNYDAHDENRQVYNNGSNSKRPYFYWSIQDKILVKN